MATMAIDRRRSRTAVRSNMNTFPERTGVEMRGINRQAADAGGHSRSRIAGFRRGRLFFLSHPSARSLREMSRTRIPSGLIRSPPMTKTTVNISECIESIRDCLIDGDLAVAAELRDKVHESILQDESWLTSDEEHLITSF